jgi:hypothetical protein
MMMLTSSTQAVLDELAGNGGLVDAKRGSHAPLIPMGLHGLDQHLPLKTIQGLLQSQRVPSI